MAFTVCGICSLFLSLTMLFFLVLVAMSPVYVDGAAQYLYNVMDPSEYYPIIDYVAPPKNASGTSAEVASKQKSQLQFDKPDFLYKAEGSKNRIVEFYAPWCPHCQHFKSHYIKFAREMKEVIKRYDIDVEFYAVSCVPNKRVCVDYKVPGYPTIRVFPKESLNSTKVKYYDLHPFQILRLLGISDTDKINMDEEDSKALESLAMNEQKLRTTYEAFGKRGKGREKKFKRTKTDIYNDAHLSFDFTMRNNVFMQDGTLPNKTQEVLGDWLELLQYSMPPTWHLQSLLREMRDKFKEISQNEANMEAILDKYPPREKEWSLSCTKGKQGMGYTCGLWELFHIMTLGVVEWNQQVISDDGYNHLRTLTTADTLRDFIELFFGCEVCRMNFLKEYDSCQFERCNRLTEDMGTKEDWIQLPLWLYELHNAVNVRLLHEKAERDVVQLTKQDDINVKWPLKHECPKCWIDEDTWDEKVVYDYLRLEYWENDHISLQKRKDFRLMQQEYKNNVGTRDDYYDDDQSTFFSFFAVELFPVAALLGLLFVAYNRKRQRDLSGLHKKTDA